MNKWITWHKIDTWKKNTTEGTIGNKGREVNQTRAQIRHANYRNQVIGFVIVHPMCSFTEIYTGTGIKRTTCNTIVKQIAQDGVIQRKKIKQTNGQQQFVYYVAEMPESGQLEQSASLWLTIVNARVQILLSA